MTGWTGQSGRRTFLRSVGLMGGAAAAVSAMRGEDPFAALPPEVWSNSRANGLVMIRHPAPEGIASKTKAVGAGEPGEPLIVTGRVFAPDGKHLAAGVTVYAYNTDAQGYYGEGHKAYPPRIYGWMKTDSEGRFELATIKPGRYPKMHVPAHIHFSRGSGYPPQWVEDLRFEGDSYLTRTMIEEDKARGEFATIQPLQRGSDGRLHCSFLIRLESRSNFSAG